jgi:hypothetical protein
MPIVFGKSISGTISGPGGPGATVTFTGLSYGPWTTTADGSGNYMSAAIHADTYTVVPSLVGFLGTYTPASQIVVLGGLDISGIDFSSSAVAPTVTLVSSSSGTQFGGTSVTITGTDFVATPTVTFGGVSATSVVWVNSTTLTCVTPAHAPGAVNVVVTNPDAQTGTLSSGYTYLAVVITVDVDPDDAVILPGAAQQYTATVTTGTVTWSTDDGSISGTGLYTAPVASLGLSVRTNAPSANRVQLRLCGTSSLHHVTATSDTDPTKFDTVSVVAGLGPLVQIGALGDFDPRRDLEIYIDGQLVPVQTFFYDANDNRYLLFMNVNINLQGVIQVVHHMPSLPFLDSLGHPVAGFALRSTFYASPD